MKYFTPALYQRFNSNNLDIADAADTAWDNAQEKYQQRLAAIRKRLPAALTELAEQVCLHDAEVLNLLSGDKEAFLWVRKRNLLYVLRYQNLRGVQVSSPLHARCFSANLVRWLYDEVDVSGRLFVHRILLSSGSTMLLTFGDFQMSQLEVHPVGTQERLQSLAQDSSRGSKRTNGTAAYPTAIDEALFHQAGLVSVNAMVPAMPPKKAATARSGRKLRPKKPRSARM
ncbi:MAG: hypothetical protein ACR2FY_13340 [Pirellulaceae bacterium]